MIPLAQLLRRVDGRVVLGFGTLLIGIACVMASDLSAQWATEDFLPSQIPQAIGQSFALTALVVLLVRSIVPAEALTIGCLLQISRLFGGEIGTAFMQTLIRVREQTHSNLIGLHVVDGAVLTADWLAAYSGRVGAHLTDPARGGRASVQTALERNPTAGERSRLCRRLRCRDARSVRVSHSGCAHAPRTALSVLITPEPYVRPA